MYGAKGRRAFGNNYNPLCHFQKRKPTPRKGKRVAPGHTAGHIWSGRDHNPSALSTLPWWKGNQRSGGNRWHINLYDSVSQCQRLNVLTAKHDHKWQKGNVIFQKCFDLLVFLRASTSTAAHCRGRWSPLVGGAGSPRLEPPQSYLKQCLCRVFLRTVARTRGSLDLTPLFANHLFLQKQFSHLPAALEQLPAKLTIGQCCPWAVPKAPAGPKSHFPR